MNFSDDMDPRDGQEAPPPAEDEFDSGLPPVEAEEEPFVVEDAVAALMAQARAKADAAGGQAELFGQDIEGGYTEQQMKWLNAASSRHVPRHQDVRDVVVMERPMPTQALREIKLSFAWWVEGARAAMKRQGGNPSYEGLRGGTRPMLRIIFGSKGGGKTSSAGWVLARSEVPSVYVRASTLIETARSNRQRDREQIDRWRAARIMVIDEVGRATNPDDDAILRGWLWGAYEEGRGIIMLSNLMGDQLKERLFDEMLEDRTELQAARGLPCEVFLGGGSLRSPEGQRRIQEYLERVAPPSG